MVLSPDTTQLEAVNRMRALIGAGAVNSLTSATDEDTTLAISTLNDVIRELQLRGWHWNTDLEQSITEDSNGRHPWQSDWIAFDPLPGAYPSLDLVRRGGFLHDLKTGSNQFSTSPLKGDVVRFVQWDDMPQEARNFCMIRATRIFLGTQMPDETRAGFALADERRAWAILEQRETEQGDYTIFDTGPAVYVRNRPGGTGLRPGPPQW